MSSESPTSVPFDVGSCIRFSNTWLSDPQTFSESERNELRQLHRLQFCPVGDAPTVVNFGKSEEGKAVVDGWESNAVTLDQLYAAHHKENPDQLLLPSACAAKEVHDWGGSGRPTVRGDAWCHVRTVDAQTAKKAVLSPLRLEGLLSSAVHMHS